MCTRTIGSGGIEYAENSAAIAQQRTKQCQQTEDESQGGRTTGDRRVRDRDGFRRRAAAFCARIALSSPLHSDTGHGNDANEAIMLRRWPPNLDALEVLMVSGRTARDGYWVLPGGGVENMESTEEAVIRELREEAGIRGKVMFCIGEFVDDQRFHHTTLFFLTVREVFTEWGENCENGRQRRWMGMEEARQRIKQTQRDMLERSIKIIEQTLGDQLEPSVSKCLSAVPVVSLRAAEDAIHHHQQQQKHRTMMAKPAKTTECAIVIMVEEAAEGLPPPSTDGLLMEEDSSNKKTNDGMDEEEGRGDQQHNHHHRIERADEVFLSGRG